MPEVITDIPKFYTALAEWLACVLFVIHLPKRFSKRTTIIIVGVSFVLLCNIQYLIGIVPLFLWIPGMIVALAFMYGIIFACCRISWLDAGFYWAIAFISAEFSASLEWQMYSFVLNLGYDQAVLRYLFLGFFYGLTFWGVNRWEKGCLVGTTDLKLSRKELTAAAIIAIGAFLLSNISYVNSNTPFSGEMGAQAFYIRTLVDFAGVVMLLSYQNRCKDLQAREELSAIQAILYRQYELYQQSQETMELVNQKYHDLKHQIGIIRMETDDRKREEYLCQIEHGIFQHETLYKTGNPVLDTILAGKQMLCQKNNINLTVVADGAKLQFMETMDICSIFGNIMDNAIESTLQIEDTEKRLIRLAVYEQNQLLCIRIENYYENQIKTVNGEFLTSKKDSSYHGYGIKSIRYVAEKYGGYLSITTKRNWFTLCATIPIPDMPKAA